MSLLHEDKITLNRAEFVAKVIAKSKEIGIQPDWIMQVMYNESGLNHQAVNPITNATGLIQFMPDTARALGVTVDMLKRMSNVEQLDYVFKYLRPFRFKIWSYIDLYFAVFFPLAIGKPLAWVFKAANLAASKIAQQNPAFDLDKNGQLTVKEVEQAMLAKVPAAYRELFKKKV
jgi:membrane-bound lytic murein transglycosylase MltF